MAHVRGLGPAVHPRAAIPPHHVLHRGWDLQIKKNKRKSAAAAAAVCSRLTRTQFLLLLQHPFSASLVTPPSACLRVVVPRRIPCAPTHPPASPLPPTVPPARYPRQVFVFGPCYVACALALRPKLQQSPGGGHTSSPPKWLPGFALLFSGALLYSTALYFACVHMSYPRSGEGGRLNPGARSRGLFSRAWVVQRLSALCTCCVPRVAVHGGSRMRRLVIISLSTQLCLRRCTGMRCSLRQLILSTSQW